MSAKSSLGKLLLVGCSALALSATQANAGWWSNTESKQATSTNDGTRTAVNSYTGQHLTTRDYTKTRSPYPVGAPPVYADAPIDHSDSVIGKDGRPTYPAGY